VASVVAALAAAGSASAAFQALPPGDQVNNDPAAGINPTLPVSIEDPANSDVVGGSLGGAVNVPWAVFRQTEASPSKDQIFSRSFANGKWTTRGNGTVGGRSSASPTFSGSLNFDQGQDGEAPSIDFAGANRAVPWASWYEHTSGTGFDANNIFASRFDSASNKWVFSGQGRGNGGAGPDVPSLNIHTNRDAENPVVAGGSTADPTKPGPWITWQEQDLNDTMPAGTTSNQIFVTKPIGPGTTACPAGTKPSGGNPIGGFCFQQVGIDRVNSGADPSLNVDRTRDGIEPDIAFTGANDSVPWVVWYEQNPSKDGLHNNEMVFAAKATANPAGDGQFQWTTVGVTGTGVLDNSAHGGACGLTPDAEAGCSVNKNANADAEDPRVAAGTMTPGNATVPWVVWDEGNALSANDNSVFVARLVGAGAAARFVIANGGQPVGTGDRADITFSGNTPYVTWHHNGQVVSGHFTTPDSFVKDGAVATNASDQVRAPISSGCTADPFNKDGSACQAGAVGTPFFLFTDGDAGHAKLFANAYQADTPATGAATGVTTSSATLNGSVNPEGAAINVSFQFGPTTAYGSSTPAQKIGVSNTPTPFSAQLTGLAPGTTIHYRAVVSSDFAPPLVGGDQTLTTAPAAGHLSAGHASVRGSTASLPVACTGVAGQSCTLAFRITVTEKIRRGKLIAVTARKQHNTRQVVVTIGSRPGLTLSDGQSKIVTISLNRTGQRLLASRHTLKATLDVTQLLGDGRSRTISQTVTFKAPTHKKHHH
jgi:hypothetical protein